jgi:hypothetical protein
MPVLQPTAPYDSLATVTQLVRTYLGDFIQNFNPNLQGVCSTNGITVTATSGSPFNILMNGGTITIANVQYTVLAVNSYTSLTLTASAGVQAGANFSAIISTGDIFADSQNYVLPTIQAAWLKAQRKLTDKSHPRLENEVDLFNFPVVANLDPMSQCYISWTQFFDGTEYQAAGPFLPADFVSPLRIWERQYSSNVPNLSTLLPMHPAPNGLRSKAKGSWNRYWDWREDAIYFPGSIVNMDWRLRYVAGLPNLVVNQQGFAYTPVPLIRASEAIANYAAAIFVTPRGGQALAAGFLMEGDAAIDQVTNTYAKMQQRASFSRRAWGRRGRANRRLALM